MKNIKAWKLILAVVVVVGLASATFIGGRQVALADSSNRGAEIIFTKWVTSAGDGKPVLMNMEGVVSGDAGAGKYAGEVLEYNPTDAVTKITALYHINGGTHQFTARLSVTQDNKKGTAVLKGVVTDGWMKGAEVSGNYQVIAPSGIINALPPSVGGDVCYQGTLRLEKR